MNRDEAKNWILESCGAGWLTLVDQIYDELPERVEVLSVYQKWAELHCDTSREDEVFDKALSGIQNKSRSMCEICGEKGSHYIIDFCETVRCEKHSEGGALVPSKSTQCSE